MKFSRRFVYVALIVIGTIDLAYFLLHDTIDGNIPYYGYNDRIAIILGLSCVLFGAALLLLTKGEKTTGLLSKKIGLFESLLLLALVALLCGAGGMAFSFNKYVLKATGNKEFSIGIYYASSENPLAFSGEGVQNPVLTRLDVTDNDALIVADPFMVHEDGKFYMFFEVLDSYTAQGNIGLATSVDGEQWAYEKIVLDEPFHLSYPFIFKWRDEYYMIPETASTYEVRLYVAEEFPYSWTYVKTILDDRLFKDTTLLFHENKWWLFTETLGNSILRLYYADTPLGPWTEHPQSPVVSGNPNIARPGGKVIAYPDRLVRFAQDDEPYYGNQVWAFEITRLSIHEYREIKIGRRPVLKGEDNWNKRGMHHICPVQIGPDKWIAVVDGY